MTTIFRALKRVNSWVCAIDTLTINAEADRLQHANFSLDKLTVLASIPRIRIKMIILAPVEITSDRQQSNYLKPGSCSRHETCARINYRNMSDFNTITCLLRQMKKWSLEFALVMRPVCPGLFKQDAPPLPPPPPPPPPKRSLNQHHDSLLSGHQKPNLFLRIRF